MSEPKPGEQYHVSTEEVKEAMDMLGKGYEHPAVVITPPVVEIAMGEEPGFYQTKTPAFIKISTAFKKHMNNLRGARLAIWLYIALSINENGTAYPSIETIERDTGYSNRTIIDVVKDLEGLGYLSVDRRGGTSHLYTIKDFAAIGKTQPTHELSSYPGGVNFSAEGVNFSALTHEETSHKLDINKIIKQDITPPNFQKLTPRQAASIPELQRFEQATGYFPGQPLWEVIYTDLHEHGWTVEQIRKPWVEWCKRGYNQRSLSWMEWINSPIPERRPSYTNNAKNDEPSMYDVQEKRKAEAWARMEALNANK